jgi:molybdopterin converting factor small subunit
MIELYKFDALDIMYENKKGESSYMTSIKKLEDKLEKKKIRLQKLLAEKDKLEIKIKELRADIEKLQAHQFEQFKKAAKRENIEIRVDDIPEILQLIKNLQQGSKIEILETSDIDTVVDDSSFESSRTDDVDEDKIIQRNGLRTLDSLESIAAITARK